jgi:hypothetical protein
MGADHLQAVTARLVRSEHKSGSFDSLLDHGQLALKELEIDNLPRLSFFAGEMLLTSPLRPVTASLHLQSNWSSIALNGKSFSH